MRPLKKGAIRTVKRTGTVGADDPPFFLISLERNNSPPLDHVDGGDGGDVVCGDWRGCGVWCVEWREFGFDYDDYYYDY